MRQDVLFGLRQIALHPGMAVVAIGTLAIAMAANTAVFAVVNALVLKPLPVAAPDELARIKAGETQMAWANYDDHRRTNTVFSDVAAYRRLVLGLSSGDRSVRLLGQRTSSNFFSVLGVNPAIGRSYTPGDSRSDLVVRSDRVWLHRFGGDRSVVGSVVTLGGRPYEVVGVMPPSFRGVESARVISRAVASGQRDRFRYHSARSRRVGVRGRGTSAIGRHTCAGDV